MDRAKVKEIAAAWLESALRLEGNALQLSKDQIFADIDSLFSIGGHRVSTNDRCISRHASYISLYAYCKVLQMLMRIECQHAMHLQVGQQHRMY